jgi:hypothetical protein
MTTTLNRLQRHTLALAVKYASRPYPRTVEIKERLPVRGSYDVVTLPTLKALAARGLGVLKEIQGRYSVSYVFRPTPAAAEWFASEPEPAFSPEAKAVVDAHKPNWRADLLTIRTKEKFSFGELIDSRIEGVTDPQVRLGWVRYCQDLLKAA